MCSPAPAISPASSIRRRATSISTGPDRRRRATFDSWSAKAKEHPGSWWPHWQKWIEKRDKTRVPARKIGNRKYKPIEDAPGSYVRVRA